MTFDPHAQPGQQLEAMCLMCVHYSPKSEGLARPTCPAFPQGIPERIMYGEDDWMIPEPHLEVLPDQQGQVVFEADTADGVTDEMVEEWDEVRYMLLKSRAREAAGYAPGEDVE